MKKRQIRLISLKVTNYKGIREECIYFGEANSISSCNGGNKSTLASATKYACGENETNFKPLNKEGKPCYGLNPGVELTFCKDGVVKKFYKSQVENWVKKKGQVLSVLAGYKTIYNIDGVSVTQGEYNTILKEFLEIAVLKMLMEPSFFPSLDWKEQRKIALEIIGDISNDMVIEKKMELYPLREILEDTTIDDYLKVTKSKILKVKEEKNIIPWRIEECRKSMEDTLDIELYREALKELREEITLLEKKRGEIFKVLEERNSTNEEILRLKEEKSSLEKMKIMKMEAPILEKREKAIKLKMQIESLEEKLTLYNRNLLSFQDDLNMINTRIAMYKNKQEELREAWRKEEETEIVVSKEDEVCPFCLRAFEGENLEKAKEKAIKLYEEAKEKRLMQISKEGKGIATYLEGASGDALKKEKEIEKQYEKIENINKEKEDVIELFRLLKEEITEFKLKEPYLEEEKVLNDKIEALQGKMESLVVLDKHEVNEKIASLLCREKDIEKSVLTWEQNERHQKRIDELEDRRKELEERQAFLERREYLCEEFIRTKVSLLEENINSKFSLVSFKLFKEQINGGLQETCECTIDGVPYSSLNTAAKMNAGIDIINTLSNHYGLSGPVFLDNRESVLSILKTDAQVINLIVSRDKKLVIKHDKPLNDSIVRKLEGYLDREIEGNIKKVKMVEGEGKRKREVDF